jgi:signal peptidase
MNILNLKNLYYYLFLIFFISLGLFISLSGHTFPGGLRLFTVQTGSMAPTLPIGSLIFTLPSKDYRLGDIITFPSPDPSLPDVSSTTTHRIFGLQIRADQAHIITKGDANFAVDNQPVPFDSIIGHLVFSLPLLGYLVDFLKSRQGTALFAIPATLIVYHEVKNIFSLLKRQTSVDL